MKTKTLKSLSLKKQTISNLENIEMKNVKGGTEKYTCSGCISDIYCIKSVGYSCDCPITL